MADNDDGTNPWARLSVAGRFAALVGLLLMLWIPTAGSAQAAQASGTVPAAVTTSVADKGDPCDALKGTPGYKYCTRDNSGGSSGGSGGDDPCKYVFGKSAHDLCENDHNGGSSDGTSGLTNGASQHVKDLANWLIGKIEHLVAPGNTWAPKSAKDEVFTPFLWLGQHLAVAIFMCVVAVCALSAWQGTPRLKQMGYSTGWTLVAVAGMASVPGFVFALNTAVSDGFKAAIDSDSGTLFGAIKDDLARGADSGNPLAILIIIAVLCVALAIAALVYATRNPGILMFVCMSPLVIASLARGGDMEAVQKWAQRLLGLMFAPFALLLVSPFVSLFKGSLVADALLLIAADVLMLRMIFHGVPYFGPRMARAARSMVERRTDNPLIQRAVRAGVPDFFEQENSPRGPRLVTTPGRAMGQDADVLAAAYGFRPRPRPGRLTTDSVVSQINTDAARTQRLMEARRQARAANQSAGSRRTPAANPTPAPASRRTPSTPPSSPSSPPPPRSGGSGSGPATP
ncbi:hypothetical protein AB0D86_43840 [Streptomyces sp. NPDC048324]|uniref:hypothetical protein n=1 Tax=Streptomyces sp. NPDC048324 TaxID=3157205 RepID=UPI00344A7975